MNAEEIVEAVGKGVRDALTTSQFFLGIEQFEFENADIHPEYITTVKVAENLTAPEHIVSLETHMKVLRRHVSGLARFRPRLSWNQISHILSAYVFGKDSQRIDIVVRSSDPTISPLLIVEAKLGKRNLPYVVADIDRVLKILSMYSDLQVLSETFYGAVVFHLMEEGGTAETLAMRSSNFLTGIRMYLANQQLTKPWLNYQAGLLSRAQITEEVSGYQEHYPDGTSENVFAKDRFAFAPGMVLLGRAADILSVKF